MIDVSHLKTLPLHAKIYIIYYNIMKFVLLDGEVRTVLHQNINVIQIFLTHINFCNLQHY